MKKKTLLQWHSLVGTEVSKPFLNKHECTRKRMKSNASLHRHSLHRANSFLQCKCVPDNRKNNTLTWKYTVHSCEWVSIIVLHKEHNETGSFCANPATAIREAGSDVGCLCFICIFNKQEDQPTKSPIQLQPRQMAYMTFQLMWLKQIQ